MQVGHRVTCRAQIDIRLCPNQLDLVFSDLVSRPDGFATVAFDALKVILSKFSLADLAIALEYTFRLFHGFRAKIWHPFSLLDEETLADRLFVALL